ncbi:hypothetical protein V6Z12_A13G172300 [Gossypium hirsutum]
MNFFRFEGLLGYSCSLLLLTNLAFFNLLKKKEKEIGMTDGILYVMWMDRGRNTQLASKIDRLEPHFLLNALRL